jgi:hypothetical protein
VSSVNSGSTSDPQRVSARVLSNELIGIHVTESLFELKSRSRRGADRVPFPHPRKSRCCQAVTRLRARGSPGVDYVQRLLTSKNKQRSRLVFPHSGRVVWPTPEAVSGAVKCLNHERVFIFDPTPYGT